MFSKRERLIMNWKELLKKWWFWLIIIIVIICIFFIYRYLSVGCDFCNPCRTSAVKQCSACKNLNWTATHEADKNLQECAKIYFPVLGDLDWNDCSNIKQSCKYFIPEV